MPKDMDASCVYCIWNVQTGKRYVGSTQGLGRRKVQHLYSLRKGSHYSALMQKEFDEYKEESFRFIRLETVFTLDRQVLYDREQYWIDKYNPEYNTNPTAGDVFMNKVYSPEWKEALRQRHLGCKRSQESKDKQSESMKKYYLTHTKIITPEQREHLRQINLGEKNPGFGLKRSDETRRKMSISNSKILFTFLSPDRKEVTIRNLRKSCIPDAPSWALREVSQGKRKEYHGWSLVRREKIATT